jgi:hypothetical protein
MELRVRNATAVTKLRVQECDYLSGSTRNVSPGRKMETSQTKTPLLNDKSGAIRHECSALLLSPDMVALHVHVCAQVSCERLEGKPSLRRLLLLEKILPVRPCQVDEAETFCTNGTFYDGGHTAVIHSTSSQAQTG